MENYVGQAPPSRRIRSFFIKDILEHKTSSSNSVDTTTADEHAVVNQENSTVTARSKSFSVRHLLATNEKRTEQETCISGCCECSPGYQYTTVNTRPYYHPYLYSIYRQQAAWRHSLKGGVAYVNPQTALYSQPKQRKARRPWTRAVFSNLQRKGLEKRFQVQKYLTKGDRHQLASMLGLSDNQVKVWFQNRRMKWRQEEQTTEEPASSTDKKPADSVQTVTTSAVGGESKDSPR